MPLASFLDDGRDIALAQYIPPPAGQTFAPATPVAPDPTPAAAPRRHEAATSRTATSEEAKPHQKTRSARATRAAERRAARAAARKEAREKKAAAKAAAREVARAKAAAKHADKTDTGKSAAATAEKGAEKPVAKGSSDEIVVLAGEPMNTNARSAEEIADLVAPAGVKVRPELGKISLERLTDPDETKNADMAIMQSDVLDEARRNGGPALLRQLNFIARLYNQEIHVVAHASVTSFADLDGKPVAVGSPDTPGGHTAAALFIRAGLKPRLVVADEKAALDKLRRGEVQAAVFLGGKPIPALRDLKIAGLHLVSIPYKGPMQDYYYPARITAADYPGLVKPGADVDSVAIGTVLVALDARPGTRRYRNLTRFTEAFFDGFATLRASGHHPKWREVNLAADVPGWRRFLPAQRWLDKAPALSDQRVTDAVKKTDTKAETKTGSEDFKRFVQSRPALDTMSGQDQEKLFKEFLRWNKEHGK